MIDPLGPDPTASANPATQAAEIGSDVEIQNAAPSPRPQDQVRKLRSSPAALAPPDAAPRPAATRSIHPRARRPKTCRRLAPRPPRIASQTHHLRTCHRAWPKPCCPSSAKCCPCSRATLSPPPPISWPIAPMHDVDLKPLEDSIARLQADQRALAFHTTEQKRAIRAWKTIRRRTGGRSEERRRSGRIDRAVAKLAKRTPPSCAWSSSCWSPPSSSRPCSACESPTSSATRPRHPGPPRPLQRQIHRL